MEKRGAIKHIWTYTYSSMPTTTGRHIRAKRKFNKRARPQIYLPTLLLPVWSFGRRRPGTSIHVAARPSPRLSFSKRETEAQQQRFVSVRRRTLARVLPRATRTPLSKRTAEYPHTRTKQDRDQDAVSSRAGRDSPPAWAVTQRAEPPRLQARTGTHRQRTTHATPQCRQYAAPLSFSLSPIHTQ